MLSVDHKIVVKAICKCLQLPLANASETAIEPVVKLLKQWCNDKRSQTQLRIRLEDLLRKYREANKIHAETCTTTEYKNDKNTEEILSEIHRMMCDMTTFNPISAAGAANETVRYACRASRHNKKAQQKCLNIIRKEIPYKDLLKACDKQRKDNA